jgi:hypothetical protein
VLDRSSSDRFYAFFFGAILAIGDGIPMLDLLDVHMSVVVLEPFYCALKHL